MANLRNFSDDEHIMLSHILAVDALANKLSELSCLTAQEIKSDVALFSGKYISEMSNDDVRHILSNHRLAAREERKTMGLTFNTNQN